jgi:hypothetical protein
VRIMVKAPKHSKNRFAGTARPPGTKARWITSPFFQPKHTITVGNHTYRFSSSSHGPDTPAFREQLKASVAVKKRAAVSEWRVLIARFMTHGTHYGYILYVRDARSKRLRPEEREAMGFAAPCDNFHDKQLRFSKSKLRDRKERK